MNGCHIPTAYIPNDCTKCSNEKSCIGKSAVFPSSHQEAALLHPSHVAGGLNSRMETVSAAHLTASALAMQPESGQKCAAKKDCSASLQNTDLHVLSSSVLSLSRLRLSLRHRPMLLLFLQSRPEPYSAHWAYLAAKNRSARALSLALGKVISRAILIFSPIFYHVNESADKALIIHMQDIHLI